jgi:hypothetical protein
MFPYILTGKCANNMKINNKIYAVKFKVNLGHTAKETWLNSILTLRFYESPLLYENVIMKSSVHI